ncbi:hypothetical protein QYE76_029700 [Lolium multiflorum]|uniref:Expansin-like EG45 domain-containing protein n=1 Tax=Lolium multiflorum TaxID=4521 RepID=A0AAD8QQY2_LOLMU|nr:hypothetical protein QYE76_029700 [Lolium multiflorum]
MCTAKQPLPCESVHSPRQRSLCRADGSGARQRTSHGNAFLSLPCLLSLPCALLRLCPPPQLHPPAPATAPPPLLHPAIYSSSAVPSSNYSTFGAPSSSSGWLPAKATWYGKPNGAGPINNGGACNFKNNHKAPFFSMTSCGNQALFKDGAGCGACYQIRCNKKNYPECSNVAKTVVITDINDGPMAKYHFDLSGTAFGAMALPGRNAQLRRAGKISIQFRRVPCNWPGVKITFYVLKGANPYYTTGEPTCADGQAMCRRPNVGAVGTEASSYRRRSSPSAQRGRRHNARYTDGHPRRNLGRRHS